jgi:asparagine synthase (glutamine-hydrolysing)
MCGIAGIWTPNSTVSEPDLQRLAQAMLHRGPDEGGIWLDTAAGLGFAHRRLSIVDLSAAGHQPMHSHDGRWVITYNGELYNYQTLRTQLEARGPINWRGHSDTEVLVEGIVQWGVETTLQRINGMFAFALWDRQERRLYLARDRMGEKPIYVAFLGTGVAFASELKALRQLSRFEPNVDRRALGLLLKYGYVPSPFSIYKNTFKLAPARYIAIDGNFSNHIPSIDAFAQHCRAYWSIQEIARHGTDNPLPDRPNLFVDELEAALRRSVSQRLVADVPVGAFLSGGIDSSLVVAMMQQQSSNPVKTFTIGFDESRYDESVYAEAVAAHLGTNHHTVQFRSRDALDRLPTIAQIYDEPLADASQLPTLMLAEITRPHVKVSLSGDGADELFGGYPRYSAALRYWQIYRKFPSLMRSAAGKALVATGKLHNAGVIRRLQRLGQSISQDTACGIYGSLIETWPLPQELVLGLTRDEVSELYRPCDFSSFDDAGMLLMDQCGYLPDNLMVKTDRASMASSLEARMPFLDPDLVALSWRIPLQDKMQGQHGKLPLRALLRKYLPAELIDRPKRGFNAPIGEWIRSPLREWAEDLLSPIRLRQEGFFFTDRVQAIWQRHLAGHDESQALWTILTFQSWLSQQKHDDFHSRTNNWTTGTHRLASSTITPS